MSSICPSNDAKSKPFAFSSTLAVLSWIAGPSFVTSCHIRCCPTHVLVGRLYPGRGATACSKPQKKCFRVFLKSYTLRFACFVLSKKGGRLDFAPRLRVMRAFCAVERLTVRWTLLRIFVSATLRPRMTQQNLLGFQNKKKLTRALPSPGI